MRRTALQLLMVGLWTGGLLGCPEDPGPESTGDDCITELASGEQVFTCNDLVFDVSVPEECLSSACGIILDVHGFTMTGPVEDLNTNLRALGREHGYVVIQPTAPGLPTSWEQEEHGPLVWDFLERAIAVYGVDDARVHMTGFSQGGFMTWRTVCAHADVLASAAPAASSATVVPGNDSCDSFTWDGCGFSGDQTPPREIPLLFMHGTQDALVDIDCALAQRDAVVDAWGMVDQGPVAGDTTYTRTRYLSAAGTTFEFIQHEYTSDVALLEGHCFPGSDDLEPSQPGQPMGFGCSDETSFHWGEEVMQFFVDHPEGG